MKFLEDPLPAIATIGIYIDIDYNWDPVLLYISDIELNSPGYIENNKDLDLDLDGLKM